MITLKANKRKDRNLKELRAEGKAPAVLYGPKLKNLSLEVDLKEFNTAYKKAGESSLLSLKVEGEKDEFLVLIHALQNDAISGEPTHIDFYQPNLKEKVAIHVPLVVTGESVAVESLGGTLVKNISELEVKALPQELPKEIKVDISGLKTFEDNILVKELKLPENVETTKDPEEIVIMVSAPEKVEEELEKPIEEGETEVIAKEGKEGKEPAKEEEKKEEKPVESKEAKK